MKIYANRSQVYPLDQYVGKPVWVKVTISGKDVLYWGKWATAGYMVDNDYYAKLEILCESYSSYYYGKTIPASFVDGDERMPSQHAAVASRVRISRDLVKLVTPIDILGNEEMRELTNNRVDVAEEL